MDCVFYSGHNDREFDFAGQNGALRMHDGKLYTIRWFCADIVFSSGCKLRCHNILKRRVCTKYYLFKQMVLTFVSVPDEEIIEKCCHLLRTFTGDPTLAPADTIYRSIFE